jgi:hypothetical protein
MLARYYASRLLTCTKFTVSIDSLVRILCFQYVFVLLLRPGTLHKEQGVEEGGSTSEMHTRLVHSPEVQIKLLIQVTMCMLAHKVWRQQP